MSTLAMILIGLIAALHVYILWFEMFAWESRGPKIFRGFEAEMFPKTKVMAANQGLYNGFLAAGLIWSLLIRNAGCSANVATFFLLCVLVAGVYGAASASRRILYVQALPAAVALLLIFFG